MTDATTPIIIAEKEYHLRYTYEDFKRAEKALGIGFVHFVRDEIFQSLTAQEAYLWCGLKRETQGGQWVHEFPQTPAGQEAVGNLIWDHLQQHSGNFSGILSGVFDAFVTTGPWKRLDPNTDPTTATSEEPKN